MILISCALFMVSCSKDEQASETGGLTIIYNIKILNAGVTGTEVLTGTIDEDKKEINFPEVDPLTDLSKVSFEADLPEGAVMDEETYDFSMPEGKSELKRIITVKNGKRYRSYYATIRLDLPVWGADFSDTKMKVYDFSGRSAIYPDLADASTRSVDMDINHVLVVSRAATGPHLLKLDDLKKNEIKPIKLDMTGVKGGTFAYSAGRLSHGHIYISNMATPSATSPVKLYHWASSTAAPQLIASVFSADLGNYSAGRFGDYMSLDLDASGNGYAFFGVNGSQANYKLLRLKITGFTTTSEPTLVNVTKYGGLWGSCNQVDGAPDDYIYTGHQGPIMLINASGQIQYSVPATNIANADGSDARVITFNKERYLVMFATPGAGSINVYDITEGQTTADALGAMVNANSAALLKYSLGGSIAAGTAVGSIGWAKDGDNKLYIMGGGPGAGFTILELPKKVKDKK